MFTVFICCAKIELIKGDEGLKEYGLVLAGGGAKGMYQLGAWKAMRELGIKFSVVAGVSIGSINGALIVSDSYEDASELWKCASVDRGVKISRNLKDPENLFSLNNASVLFREILKNGGIDASPTKKLLTEFIDEEKVRKSDIKLGLVTFSLSDFAPKEIFVDKIPEGELIDYLLASSKVPGVSKIGPEDEKYLDGGVYDNTPVSLLRKYGYNRMIVVDISAMKGVGHKDNMNNAEIIYIRPYDIDELGASFDFSDEMYEKRIKMGYLDARKAFGYLLGRQFYFEPAVFRKMIDEYGADALEQLENLGYELEAERLKVYSQEEFISEIKRLYDEHRKLQQEKEEELEQKFYGPLLKKLPKFHNDNEFAEAIAVLENIVE